jgi:hypothetical protein
VYFAGVVKAEQYIGQWNPETRDMTKVQRFKDWVRTWSTSILGTTFKVLWTALITALFVAAINRYQVLDVFGFGSPPSVATQLERIRKQEAARRRHTVYSAKLDFHGTGTLSYLMVLRDDRFDNLDASARAAGVSDEVRIYENHDGVLEMVYTFMPRSTGGLDRPFLFRIEAAEDIDGNGEMEVIGAFGPLAMEPFAPIPLMIDWDDDAGYGVRTILNNPPGFEVLRKRGIYGMASQRFYTRPTVLTDTHTLESVRGYAVEDLAVLAGPDEPVMIGSFIVKARSHAKLELIQIMGWQINVQDPNFPATPCYTKRPIFTKHSVPTSQLGQVWSEREESFC